MENAQSAGGLNWDHGMERNNWSEDLKDLEKVIKHKLAAIHAVFYKGKNLKNQFYNWEAEKRGLRRGNVLPSWCQ